MLLDGHTAASGCEHLGLLLYRWKQDGVLQGAVMAVGLESRVRELEAELRLVVWRYRRRQRLAPSL